MQLNVMLNDSINKILLDQGKQPERIEKIRNLLLFYEDLMKKLLGIETSSLTIMDEVLNEISE